MHARITSALLIIFLLAIACAPQAVADGGKVQISRVISGRRYTVFTSPTPLRPGIVDLSFLIQDVAEGNVIRDQPLRIECRQVKRELTVRGVATHAAATNRLLQSAKIDLPVDGPWQIEVVDLARNQSNESVLRFSILVEEYRFDIPWTAALVAAPLGFIAIFLLREKIRRERKPLEREDRVHAEDGLVT